MISATAMDAAVGSRVSICANDSVDLLLSAYSERLRQRPGGRILARGALRSKFYFEHGQPFTRLGQRGLYSLAFGSFEQKGLLALIQARTGTRDFHLRRRIERRQFAVLQLKLLLPLHGCSDLRCRPVQQ